MAKCWSVTSLLALALLGCLVGKAVEAQDSVWQKPAPPSKSSQLPQAPKFPQYPQAPQVLPPPPPPKAPQYPQAPQVLPPPPPPKAPHYPQAPQVLPPPPPPKAPHYPQAPQVLPPPPPPKTPQYPQVPRVLPPGQVPKAPQYPQAPQVLPPPSPPKAPHYPQAPQVLPPPLPPKAPQYPKAPQVLPPPPPPKAPQYPQVPQVLPPPKAPQYPQAPQVLPPPSPPKVPQYPQVPQVLPPPSPPKVPQYPQVPQVLPPPSPPKVPQYPQVPQVLPPPSPPKAPQYPQVPQVLPPPKAPQYPQVPQVLHPPKVPQYPQVPQVLPPPSPPKVPQYPQVPQVLPPPSPPKVPQYPQIPQPQQPPQGPQTPSTYKPRPVQSCDVEENVRIPCGGADISATRCDALNCCFDGRSCYFGKAVTVQCTKDAQFIVVVARDATLPHIDLDSLSLLGQGQSCTHVDSNSEFAIYQFPVTACGSVVMEEPGVIIYQNRMSSSYEVGVGPLGAITRDSQYELLFQCRYIGTSVETLVVEVLPLQDPPLPVAALGPIRVQLKLANGQCNTKGCNEVDVAYSSFYTEADYPVTKVLRDPVYVQVQLIEKTDPNLILTLGRCWTTTSPNPHSLPQWDILIDGCPYRDDRYLSTLVPVGPFSGVDFPSHYRRFIFKMFTFVDPKSMEPLKEQVYIHCSTAVCSAALGRSCEPSCFRKKRDVETVDQKTDEPKVVVSVGPVIMGAPEQ